MLEPVVTMRATAQLRCAVSDGDAMKMASAMPRYEMPMKSEPRDATPALSVICRASERRELIRTQKDDYMTASYAHDYECRWCR